MKKYIVPQVDFEMLCSDDIMTVSGINDVGNPTKINFLDDELWEQK